MIDISGIIGYDVAIVEWPPPLRVATRHGERSKKDGFVFLLD
jgi:hypothetical protein